MHQKTALKTFYHVSWKGLLSYSNSHYSLIINGFLNFPSLFKGDKSMVGNGNPRNLVNKK